METVTSAAAKSKSGEYLAFKLGTEEYGIDILKVQEIRGYETVTRIANAPDYIKGVINLRGVIVPVIDMRIKFNVGNAEYGPFIAIIVLNINQHVVGMVVDGVTDVTELSDEHIKPAPKMDGVLNTEFMLGISALEERMLILIDIAKLMFSEEMGLFGRHSPVDAFTRK